MAYEDAQPVATEYIPSVREILLVLWRHRLTIAVVAIVSLLIGGTLVMLKPNSYKATATLMLQDNSLNVTLNNFQDVTAGQKFDDTSVQTEVKVIGSSVVALQAIKATGLDKSPEFASRSGDQQEVVSKFLKNLSVDSQGTSRVITVTFKAHDPAVAAKAANAVVAAYLDSQLNAKKQQVEKLSAWFESKVKDLKTDVYKKSTIVEKYRADNNLIAGKDDQQLVFQQITDVSAQLAPLQLHKDDIEAKLASIESHPGAMSDIVQSPLIQNLKVQASTLSQQVEAARAQYGANHPKMIDAQKQLEQVRRAIGSETANIRSSLKNDEVATDSQISMLKERLDTLRKESDDLRSKMVVLNGLQVEQTASEKLLDSFLANYQNAQSQINFARPDAVVVSQATPPSAPAQPGKKLLLLIVIIFSGCLSLATVFVIETMQGGLRNFDDIRKLGQKPLGIIPMVDNPAQAIVSAGNNAFKESIKRIYMASLMNASTRTVLIASALPKEGRTTFATSIGHYLLSLKHKVIVVDADFLRPALSRQVVVAGGPGLTDVLAGHASLNDAVSSDDNGLAIIPAGESHFSPDLLRSSRLRELLDQLKQRYDYILIDAGPVLAHSEANVIAGQVDGLIVVTQWIKTSRKTVSNMFATLSQHPVPVLGMVINKVDIDKYKTVTTASDFLLPKTARAA